MTKIKICGLKRKEDIEYVNHWQPDYIGFVFAQSKRQVTAQQAAALREQLRPEIAAVGVFVNADLPTITELVSQQIIDIVQLHGDETAEDILTLKEFVSCPVIKAIRVKDRQTVKQAWQFPADYLLFDTFTKKEYGGSGLAFDRALLTESNQDRRGKSYFLAGGLNADNVRQAIAECHPYGVDVSSGVETNGDKDAEKIAQIIQIIREEQV